MHISFKHTIGVSMAAALTIAAGRAAAGPAESHFDAGPEGWTFAEVDFYSATGGANPPVVTSTAPLSWFGAGGHPGGYVEISVDPSPLWSWFSAPAAFLGDQSGLYGGSITFDGLSTADGTAAEILPAVVLVGASQTLYIDSTWATASWTPFSFGLTETGWYSDFFDPAGSPASKAEFLSVLGSLQALYIEGDWSTIPEMERLDNVVMVPGPGAWALACAGLLAAARRRRAE